MDHVEFDQAVVTRDELRSLVARHLPEAMQQASGSVLYTPASSIRPSPVYVMGLNTGGHPKDAPGALIDRVAPAEGVSGYTHECWRKKCGEACSHLAVDGTIRPEFRVKHQRHLQDVTDALGIPLIRIASCNAIFGRSESLAKMYSQTGFTVGEWWKACWPVHQYLLSIVRPRLIITLGYGERSSAFGLLRNEAGCWTHRPIGEQGKIGAKTFDTILPLGGTDNLNVSVVGIPHPSWYASGPMLKHQLWELASGMTP